MPNEWFTKQGPDGQWYKTQASSQDEALSKMRTTWATTNNQKPLPEPNLASKIGSYIPEAMTGPLVAAQKYLVDPFEKMAAKGSEFGGQLGQVAGQYGVPTLTPGFGEIGGGIGKAVGEMAGGIIADPRNWPMMGAAEARPILQTLIKRGFSGMLAKETYDYATHLYQNWDKMTAAERAEFGTKAGLSGLMTAGLMASKGIPAKTPEETPIAASGKTAPEVKAETTPPRTTGLAEPKHLTADEIRTRMKAVQDRIDAQKAKAPAPVPPAEPTKPAEAAAKPPIDRTTHSEYGPPKADFLAQGGVKPEQMGHPPEAEDLGVKVRPETEKKLGPIKRELPKAPEARPEPMDLSVKEPSVMEKVAEIQKQAAPKQPINTKSYSGYQIIEGRKPERVKQTIPERASGLINANSPEAQAAWEARQAILKSQREITEGAKAKDGQTSGPKVGAESTRPSAPKPEVKPIQTTEAAPRPGEPVRAAEKPQVVEPRSSEGVPSTATKEGAALDNDTLAKVKAAHPEWSMSEQLMEAAKQARPPEAKRGLGPVERLELQRKIVAELREKNPGVATARLQEMASEQIRKQQGSISFKRISEEERAAANPVKRLADALDRVAGFFEHRGLTEEEAARQQTAQNIIRGAAAEKARSHLEVMHALDEAIQRHDNPANERQNFLQFMDAGEGKEGAKFLNPADQALAGALHEMNEERWEKIKDVKGLEGEGIENYLAHLWEKPGKAMQTLSGLLTGRRPLEGSARFLKNRFYQYASEGIEHGLTPVTWNPIRLQLAALFDVDRFLMAHDIKDQFKDAGLVQWKKLSEYKDVPNGWQRLDDKIFNPKVVGEGALKEYGTYYAPPEVAKIFNRFLSPGLGANPLFRNFRNYGNTLNMINLGISGYHGTMISLVSATSDLALGMQKVLNYGDVSGIKNMLRGTVGTFFMRSAARDYSLGRAIQAEALDPTDNPELGKFVNAITKGGGRFKEDPVYLNTMTDRKGFMNWLKLAPQGKFQEMAFTGVRKIAGPIMEKFVPRIKLGVAARMMEAKLNSLAKNGVSDEQTVATELGKIWDSVDNRAGQMVYDNLFWNRAFKDLAFTAVRAVGWDLGSLREYGGGALVDLPRQAAKALRGQRPELTSRLAFTIATPITIGIFGGMVHYLMTGKAPQKTEDYFFPGPEGDKVSFPSYMKDYFSFKEHPMRTVVNKLHPTWSQMSDLYNNSDFYGTEIVHPGDSTFKQGMDILKWYGQSWEPLSMKGIQTRIERGEPVSGATTGLFGFMPAPGWVSQTKAEKLAVDLASREWKKGPRTSSDAERFALVQKFERQVGSGKKIDMSELTQAWKDKRIQDTDIAKIYSNYNVPKLQREFKELNLPDALAVMREADPNERVQLKSLLLEKYGQLERYPLDTQQQYDKEIRAFLR
jgi:hypothetical protein